MPVAYLRTHAIVMDKPKATIMCWHGACWTKGCPYAHTQECQSCDKTATWYCKKCREGGAPGWLCEEHKQAHVGQGANGNWHKPKPRSAE